VTGLSIVYVVFGVAATGMVLAFGVRRMLGVRIPLLRTLIAGAVALLVVSPIITAMAGSDTTKRTGILPILWFVMLGVAISLLVGMAFLVTAEFFIPSGSLPGPLYLVRGLRGRFGRARRYSHISRILVLHGLSPYMRGRRRSELRTSDGRARLARSLRLALEEGGVTFVKLGQVIATRRDLLPVEFVAELAGLQDNVAAVPWSEIDEVIRAELGAGVDELFADFEPNPLAAASIAQVYAATLRSGQQVVVKVCRPEASASVESDLAILERLAQRLERSTRWGRAVGVVGLVHGFGDSLREELDLRVELRNMVSVAAAAAKRGEPRVRIPVPVADLSTRRVLVMEHLHGQSLSGLPIDMPPHDRAALASSLFRCLLQEVMIDGVFHADPHPGNVLLLADGQLGLLDFGSVGRIDAGTQTALQRFLFAVDRGDPATLTDALLEIVERPEDLDEEQLQRSLGQFLARQVGAGVSPNAHMFIVLFRIVSDHGLAVPPGIAAVFRAMATMEGTLSQFAPEFDIVADARQYAADSLVDQIRPESLRETAMGELATVMPMLLRLPRRLDRITGQLETGRLGVKVRFLADDRDRRFVTGLVHRTLLAFLGATSGVMAVLMLALHGGPHVSTTITLYQFFGYSLLVVAAVLVLRVLVTVLRPEEL
jgi:ubiquinone biosynthesis protein